MTQDLVINGALITLLFLVVGAAVKITRTQAAENAELKQKIFDQDKAHASELAKQQLDHSNAMAVLRTEIVHQQREYASALETARHEFGESCNAIRQKVHDFEKWSRDEFVRKASFEVVISRMEKGLETLGTKIETRLDKMAERIEKIGQG